MEEKMEQPGSEEKGYVPRPRWQLLLAWCGIGVMIVLVIAQVVLIMRGFRL